MHLTRRGFLGLTVAAAAGCPEEEKRSGGRVRALFAGGGARETLDPHVQSPFIDIARHKAMFDKAGRVAQASLSADWTRSRGWNWSPS